MNAEPWHWLDTGAHDAARNMAIDEALLESAARRGMPLFRVYGWTRPSISIGYFQAYPADYAEDYAIVRRPTGGGMVFHGKDLTFTVIAPRNHILCRMPAADSYRAIHTWIAAALNAAGIRCTLHAGASAAEPGACFQLPVPHDIMMGEKKITGGAQRRTKSGLLHQGSLLLPPSRRKSTHELATAIRRGMPVAWTETHLNEADQCEAAEIARTKYGTDAWNRKYEA